MKTKLLIVGALAITGCVTVSKSVLTEDFVTQPIPQQQVAVLLASLGDTLPTTCTRVAILHASGHQDYTNESAMIDKFRDEAGKLGGNTVFVQNIEDAGTGERVASALFGTGADRDGEAVALRCPEGTRSGGTARKTPPRPDSIIPAPSARVAKPAAPSSLSPTTTSVPVGVPEGMNYVAARVGALYYWVGCTNWRGLSSSDVLFFETREEAVEAGYRASSVPECRGPG